jgi:CRISPR-associated protein Csy2
MPDLDGILLLPRLRVQNANAIPGPLSWGFPAPTAFLGFAHALERRLRAAEWDLRFTAVGIVCHYFEPQTSRPSGRYHEVFKLPRHPIRAGYRKFQDKDAAIVEEGFAHMEVSLLLETQGNPAMTEYDKANFFDDLIPVVHSMRLAGGSILPAQGGAQQPDWLEWWDDEADNRAAFRRLRRRLLPGFVLVQRDDLLRERLEEMRGRQADANALDALLDLCALHVEPETDDEGRTHWHYRRAPGWLVPLPVGYGAISPLYEPGRVAHTRDRETPFRFVESLYSLGQWLSPHRIDWPGDLMWRYRTDEDQGLYLCTNDYAQSMTE